MVTSFDLTDKEMLICNKKISEYRANMDIEVGGEDEKPEPRANTNLLKLLHQYKDVKYDILRSKLQLNYDDIRLYTQNPMLIPTSKKKRIANCLEISINIVEMKRLDEKSIQLCHKSIQKYIKNMVVSVSSEKKYGKIRSVDTCNTFFEVTECYDLGSSFYEKHVGIPSHIYSVVRVNPQLLSSKYIDGIVNLMNIEEELVKKKGLNINDKSAIEKRISVLNM